MHYAVLSSLALATLAAAQAKAPSSTPAGCSENYSGSFEISVTNVTSSAKRSLSARQDNNDITLVLTLQGGVLMDSKQRQGYIASNHQFQFNTPLQENALFTSGFSVCSNNTLALQSAIWYECLSGDFTNTYDESIGGQCYPVYLDVIPTGGSSPSATPSQVATELPDGQPTASVQSSAVCEYKDGQPQAGCTPTPTPTPVCEYSDGQPQAGCSSVVCEYVDGQPQAGCSSAAPAPTPTPVVCEYTDGQPQAGCSSAAPTPTSALCEYTDGQPQAGCTPAPSATVQPYVAGGNSVRGNLFGLAAGILGVAML